MDKDKLKELVLKHLAELLDEESATSGAGGYLGIKAFKPKYEATNKEINPDELLSDDAISCPRCGFEYEA